MASPSNPPRCDVRVAVSNSTVDAQSAPWVGIIAKNASSKRRNRAASSGWLSGLRGRGAGAQGCGEILADDHPPGGPQVLDRHLRPRFDDESQSLARVVFVEFGFQFVQVLVEQCKLEC